MTSIFLILFVLQLLLYAFHEFTEANALPIDNAYWHLATEEWAEGTYANMISIALVLIPLAWLGYAAYRTRENGRDFGTRPSFIDLPASQPSPDGAPARDRGLTAVTQDQPWEMNA